MVALTAVWQPSGAWPQATLVDPLANPSGGSGGGFQAEPSGFPAEAPGSSAGGGEAGVGAGNPLPIPPAASPANTGGRSVSSIFVDDNAELTLLGPVNPAGPSTSPTSSGLLTPNTGGGSSKLSIVVDDDARLTLPASAISGGTGIFPNQDAVAPVSSQADPGTPGTAAGSPSSQDFGAFDPSGSATLDNAFANFGQQGSVQNIGNGNFGRSFTNTEQSSSGGGLLGALISQLAGGGHTPPNILGALGLGHDALNSFAQIASSSVGNIARESNLGLKFVGDEIQYQGEEKLRNTFRGIQEAGRIAGEVGHNSYRGVLRKKNVLEKLAKDTVGNVGTFADEAVVASVDKVSESANAFLRLFRDLKGAFLDALIAKSQAKKRLVDAQTATKSGAVDGVLSAKSEVLRGNIRAVTNFSKYE